MIVKRVLCRHRLRRVPSQFSWVDHRLVRDRHICDRSAQALALYLFLVTVGDADGLSYYSDGSIGRQFEFLSQEMLREVNTMSSKSGDAGLFQIIFALKNEVDKFREQVFNVE